jgi:hypothetical protein
MPQCQIRKRGKQMSYIHKVKHSKTCSICQIEFKSYNSNKHYCSQSCRDKFKRLCIVNEKLQQAYDNNVVLTSDTQTKKNNKKLHQAKRRKLLKGLTINPLAVFEKYHYKCCSCQKETPLYLRGLNHHNSPEIDHIIPLSKGGCNSHDNIQLLCRECNSKKHNKVTLEGGGRGKFVQNQAK